MTGRGGRPEVLVLRALGLGDALTGIPALRALRRAHPDATLTLATGAAVGAFLRGYGVVDRVLPTRELAPLPAVEPPRLAVDLHGRGPASHDVLAATGADRLLCFASPEAGYPDGPIWRQDEHEVQRWCRLVAALPAPADPTDLLLRTEPGPADGPVLLHPGAAFGSRRWPVDRWARLAADLHDAGHQLVLTGNAAEQALCAQIRDTAGLDGAAVHDRSGATTLTDLAASVGGAALVISGDTGVAHLATALRTPSVLLFGPTPPAWWGPLVDRDRRRVLWPAGPGYRGDPHGEQVDPVLARIRPEQVLAAARAVLRPAAVPVGPRAPAPA